MAYSKGRRLSVLVDTTGALQDPPVLTFLGITDGSANQVLKTDGSGNLSFTTISSDKIAEGNTEVEVTDSGSNGTITLKTEGTNRWQVTNAGHILPVADNAYDIGSSSFKIRDIYVSDGSIKMGSDTVLSVSGGNFQVNDASGDPKKLIVDEIELGTGTDKVILKKGSDGNMEQQSKSGGSTGTARKPFLLGIHNTGDLTEASDAKFFTEGRSRGAVSVGSNSGHGSLAYNSSTGSFTFTGVTTAAIRGLISVSGSGLSYNSSTGVLTSSVAVSSVNSQTGAVSLTTANVAENTNLYYTDARARGAISVSGNAISYNSSTGVITASFEETPTFTNGLTVGSTSAGVQLSSAGSMELTRTAGSADPFIDFKDSGSDDFDARIQMDDNKLLFKTGGNSNTITALTVAATTSTDTTVNSNLVVTGNFTVQGTTTTTNSSSLAVTDTQITVAKNAANASAANNAGLIVDGPSTKPSFTYTSADDRWNMNKTLNATLVGNVTGNLTGNAGSATRLINTRNFTIGGVNHGFDGQANVDLTEAIQDTVGAMFTSNTDTGMTSTYVDASGKINLVVTTPTDNNFTTALKNKLDGIEASATADQTASEIMTAIKTVDGSGSGLDADTVDGQHASAFLTSFTETNLFLGDGGNASTHPGTSKLIFSGQISSGSNVLGMPTTNNANAFINLNKHSGEYNSQLGFSSNGNIYYRNFNNTAINSTQAFRQIWDSGNDGSGSGLDADTVDGVQASSFVRGDQSNAINLTITGVMQANNGYKVSSNTVIDSSRNLTNIANVGMATGHSSGKFAVMSSSVHGSYDFYNNGTSYFNGATIVDDNLTISGGGQILGGARIVTGGLYGTGHSSSTLPIWQYNSGNPGYGIAYTESSPDVLRFDVSGNLMSGTADLELRPNELKVNNEVVATQTWVNAQGFGGGSTDADTIDGRGFVNTGSNSGQNADTINSNGISYYTSGVTNFSGNATDGALYSQQYSSSWQHQIAADYRSGQIAVRGKNNGTWTSWNKVWTAGNDGSSSGLDADLVDGIHGSSLLRSDTADTFTGTISMGTQKALVANNYGRGVYGVYSSYRHQHVWSMGTAYNLADDGTTVGNLYGISYTHTNVGTGYGSNSAAGLGHQLNGRANGTLQWALGDGIWSSNTGSVWGASNDGSGSGLDADTVDGQQASAFVNQNGTYTLASGYSVAQGSWGLRNTTPSGYIEFGPANTGHAHIYTDRSNFYFNVNTMYQNGHLLWAANNDGSGSGLDADLLDGYHIGSFVRTDTGSTIGNNHSVVQRGQFTCGTSGQNNSAQAGALSYDFGYQFGGSWAHPYPDLVLGYHTGMRFGGHTSYGGCRFYADHPSRTTTMLFSVGNGDAHVRANNNIYAYTSDKRLKENFRPIENAVDKVKSIGGFIFDWRKDMMDKHNFIPDQEKDDAGLIAQEVQKVLPAAIKRAPFDHDLTKPNQSKSGEDFLTVQYEKVVPLLVEAIKEQQKQIDELKKLLENK